MPVGGVKEKVLAARRAGIRRVIIPKANERDLRELPDAVRAEMTFFPVETARQALAAALREPLPSAVGVS
jgi:ATP-dependent Lon protease